MAFLLTKYAFTAFVIVLVSEVAKRNDKMGALIASLPLVTVLVMIWMYFENQGPDKIANHAYYTFWYVLPTLPMFLLMPYLLHRGLNFWIALAIGALVTLVTFACTALLLKNYGVNLLP